MFKSYSLTISNNEPDLNAASRVGSRADSKRMLLISPGASQSLDLIMFFKMLTMLAA